MKTVFNNSMLAHVWAQRTQDHGRNADSSVSFVGDVFFSYRTPIAAFTPEGHALVTSRTYSATTSGKHMPAVHRAFRPGTLVFTVPDIGYDGGRASTKRGEYFPRTMDRMGWREVHVANLAWLVEQYRAEVARCMRVVTWGWLDQTDVYGYLISRCAAEVINYARVFGLEAPHLGTAEDAARIWARCERLANDPKRKARAEVRRQAELRAEELRRMDAETKLAAWQSGEDIRYFSYRDADGSAVLRVKGDIVETSLGAVVPLDHARRVFRFVELVREQRSTWTAQEHPRRAETTLGPFTLDSFDEKGIRAGCHFISWGQVERIAPTLRAEG